MGNKKAIAILEQNNPRERWISLEERHPYLSNHFGTWSCSDPVLVAAVPHDYPLIGRFEVDFMNGECYWTFHGKEGKVKEFIEGTKERFVTHWLPCAPMPEKKKK